MKRLLAYLSLSAALLSSLAGPALAGSGQPEGVLELFTSQGCSSCPPANKFAGKMAGEPDMLVLSYGVTYWDYLGWKDSFADPAFTTRQKQYAKAFGTANVYTPQMVLNGSTHGPRYSNADVRSMSLPEDRVNLSLSVQDNQLQVRRDGTEDNCHMVLVEYVPGPQSIKVDAGENSGRVLVLTNVVTDIQNWSCKAGQLSFDTNVTPGLGKNYALLLHATDSMKLIGATTLEPVPNP